MKSFIFSLIILCLVIICTIFVAIYTDKMLSNFENTIESEISSTPQESIAGIEKVETKYKNMKPFLTLFMRENDVKEIEMYIEDMRSAAKADDLPALTEAKSRLKLHIYQLRRLSVFSMESIF